MSQRLDFCDFPIAGKPSNVAMFVSNVATLLINFYQRREIVHPNSERHDVPTSQRFDVAT